MSLLLLHENSQGKMQQLEQQSLAVKGGSGQGRSCQLCLAQTQQLPQGHSLAEQGMQNSPSGRKIQGYF